MAIAEGSTALYNKVATGYTSSDGTLTVRLPGAGTYLLQVGP